MLTSKWENDTSGISVFEQKAKLYSPHKWHLKKSLAVMIVGTSELILQAENVEVRVKV